MTLLTHLRPGLLLTAVLASFGVDAAPAAQQLILQGVNVVDTRDGSIARDISVVIEGDRISRIAPRDSVTAQRGAKVIAAKGKYVVPGYLDMHAHPLNAEDPAGSLKLMLAYGITGYRQMSGTPEALAQRRTGTLVYADSPELLGMPGTIMGDGYVPDAPAAAAEVRKQKVEGADFIKEVGLTGPAFFAALDEAKAQNLQFSGHLDAVVDAREASAHGMSSIEHLGPKESVLLACSSDEAGLRRMVAAEPPAPMFDVNATSGDRAAMVRRAISNPIMATPPPEFAIMKRVMDTYDEDRCGELAALFAKNQTWQTPTLIRLRTMQFPQDPTYVDDPRARHVPPATLKMWRELAAQFPERVPAQTREMLKQFFPLQLRLVKLMHDAGVPMMAGSDFGGQWVFAGHGLHQEFDLLAQAGLSPLDVLQMSTLNGAKYLHREATMGTVEAGKQANLVLLEANPVSDVRNLHAIDGVVRGGVYYSRDALTRLENSVTYP